MGSPHKPGRPESTLDRRILAQGLITRPIGCRPLQNIGKFGPNFNPEVGFIERTDCICDYMDLNLKPRPKLRGVRELNFESFLFHAPDTHHVLQTQEWQGTFRIEFNNGSYSDDDIVDVYTQRLNDAVQCL